MSSSPRRSTHSSLEALEARIAPATVTATLASGVLKISALSPGTATILAVTAIDPDSFIVSDGPTPLGQFDGVHSVKITLSDQADTLNFFTGATFRGPVSVSAGNGADFISFGSTSTAGIAGDVTVTAKGAASVGVQNAGHITGIFSVATGTGGTAAVVSQGSVGALSTTGVSTIILDQSADIAGNVHIVAPDDGVTVTAAATIEGSLFVKGSVNPAKLDTVHLNGKIHGAVSLVFGEGGSVVDVQDTNNFYLGDSLTISGKSGPDTVNLHLSSNGGFFNPAIAGAVKISLGDGANSVSIDGAGRISGGVRVIGGAANDSLTLTNVFVGGVTRFDLGAGTNGATVTGTNLLGGLVVTSGAGDDTVNLNSPNSIGGPAKFSLGDGTNNLGLVVTSFDGGLTVTGGIGTDNVTLGGSIVRGKATFSLGEGNNQVTASSVTFRTNFTYVGTKAGNDTVNVDANSILSGTFTMNAGDGNNLLVMSTLGNLSTLSYKGGVGIDTVAIFPGGGPSGSNPAAGQYIRGKVVLGDGNDQAFLTNSAFLTFSFDGGAGNDTMNHSAAALASGPTEKNFETTNVVP